LNGPGLLSTKGLHTSTQTNEPRPNEDTWQKEFFSILTSLVPATNTVSSSVGPLFATGLGDSKGLVDFYIDDDLQWMLEFISEGSNIQEHINRFEDNGIYQHIPRKSWLIVDFRSNSKQIRKFPEGVLFVSYNDDFSSVTVTGTPLSKTIQQDTWTTQLLSSESPITTLATLASQNSYSTTTTTNKKKKKRNEEDSDQPKKKSKIHHKAESEEEGSASEERYEKDSDE